MTVVEFLKSSRSRHFFSGTKIQQQSLGRMLKTVENGKIVNIDGKRAKYIKFSDTEEKLIRYIKIIENKYKQDKCGTSWLLLQEKCVKWAVNSDIETLK